MLNTTNHQENANQNHNETSLHNQDVCYKKLQITNAGEEVEKREPLCNIGGSVNCCGRNRKQREIAQEIKNSTAI